MRNVLVTVDKESVSVIFGRDKQILSFQCRTSSCLRTGKETGDDYTQATASKLSVIQVHDNNNNFLLQNMFVIPHVRLKPLP